MFLAKIFIKRRRSILDPQGKAVEHGINSLGYKNVLSVRIDKYIELELNENDFDKAKNNVEKICNDLLANPHLEDYSFELTKK